MENRQVSAAEKLNVIMASSHPKAICSPQTVYCLGIFASIFFGIYGIVDLVNHKTLEGSILTGLAILVAIMLLIKKYCDSKNCFTSEKQEAMDSPTSTLIMKGKISDLPDAIKHLLEKIYAAYGKILSDDELSDSCSDFLSTQCRALQRQRAAIDALQQPLQPALSNINGLFSDAEQKVAPIQMDSLATKENLLLKSVCQV